MAATRNFLRIIFIILNSLAAIVFLLICLAPYLNPQKWWMFSLLGLGFGFVMVTLIAFIFFWLFFRPRLIAISIITLLIGYKAISVFFGFRSSEQFDYEKPGNVLRVAHWNVGRFTEWKRNNNKGSKTRLKMMDLIQEQNADVLCFQEFFHSTDSIYYDNLNFISKELGYPYYCYSWDTDGYKQWVGQVIFSRFPLADSGMIRFPRPSMPESLLHADVLFNNDTIRFYTTHLQSVQFKKQDFERIEDIKETKEGVVENSKSIFVKLKRGVERRSIQADVVKERISQSPHPFILTGDFNDVPNSYTYFTIKGKELKDVFLETSFGVGRTYTYIAPTLRIDYMLATKDIQIRQFNRIVRDYSDHYMLVADITVEKADRR